jgi:hypothetical protein
VIVGLLKILHIPLIHLLINPGGGVTVVEADGAHGADGAIGVLLNKLEFVPLKSSLSSSDI